MTAQQARQILLAYRPWTDDAQDPEIAEAIALCETDSESKAWFENHCAAQVAIRDQFRSLPVPDGLRQQILSEYKAHPAIIWWRSPRVLAPMAVAVLLIAVASIWFSMPHVPGQDVSFSAYRNRMVKLVRSYGMDLETNDVAQIRAYLAQHQAPADYVLPPNLERTPVVGCGSLRWQGKPVAMVCFRTGKPLPPGSKSDLFLFVIDERNLVASAQRDVPMFANVSTIATATWKAGGKVYLLAGPDATELKQRL